MTKKDNEELYLRPDFSLLGGFALSSGIVQGFFNAMKINAESLEAILLFSPALASGMFLGHEMHKTFRGDYDDQINEEIKKDIEISKQKKPMPFWLPPVFGAFIGGLAAGLITGAGYGLGYSIGYFTDGK